MKIMLLSLLSLPNGYLVCSGVPRHHGHRISLKFCKIGRFDREIVARFAPPLEPILKFLRPHFVAHFVLSDCAWLSISFNSDSSNELLCYNISMLLFSSFAMIVCFDHVKIPGFRTETTMGSRTQKWISKTELGVGMTKNNLLVVRINLAINVVVIFRC